MQIQSESDLGGWRGVLCWSRAYSEQPWGEELLFVILGSARFVSSVVLWVDGEEGSFVF